MLKFLLTVLLAVPFLSFSNPIDWENRVYLASFPRSGNHWVRYMLEEATQIATSSVSMDPEYGKHSVNVVFPWGGFCCDHGYNHRCRYPINGECAVVKTHFPVFRSYFDQLPYKLAIRLVRHPIDCFYSFYLYPASRSNPKEFIPRELLLEYIQQWRLFEEYWNVQPNVLTIRYEDLMEHQEASFRKILGAIPFCVSEKRIKQALYKHPPKDKIRKHLHHYTKEDLQLIERELGPLMKAYGYKIE